MIFAISMNTLFLFLTEYRLAVLQTDGSVGYVIGFRLASFGYGILKNWIMFSYRDSYLVWKNQNKQKNEMALILCILHYGRQFNVSYWLIGALLYWVGTFIKTILNVPTKLQTRHWSLSKTKQFVTWEHIHSVIDLIIIWNS